MIGKLCHSYLLGQMEKKTTGNLTVKGKFPKNQTVLIVANHLCIEDIPTLAQAVEEHFCILVSDEDKYTIDGVGLTLNGCVWVSRLCKKSREKAAQKAVKILKSGTCFAMYPEATWNLSPNLLMLPMNYGCIRIAKEANVPIVPVVSCFTEKERISIIGDVFYPMEDNVEAINVLRDIMATMVYEEIEMNAQKQRNCLNVESRVIEGEEHFFERRDSIDAEYWEKDIEKRYNAYARAKKNKREVRKFESQFIFTPKAEKYSYFKTFNSIEKIATDGKHIYKRISSEKDGYDQAEFSYFFGYGYNESDI